MKRNGVRNPIQEEEVQHAEDRFLPPSVPCARVVDEDRRGQIAVGPVRSPSAAAPLLRVGRRPRGVPADAARSQGGRRARIMVVAMGLTAGVWRMLTAAAAVIALHHSPEGSCDFAINQQQEWMGIGVRCRVARQRRSSTIPSFLVSFDLVGFRLSFCPIRGLDRRARTEKTDLHVTHRYSNQSRPEGKTPP
jgi:hypothetical protein